MDLFSQCRGADLSIELFQDLIVGCMITLTFKCMPKFNVKMTVHKKESVSSIKKRLCGLTETDPTHYMRLFAAGIEWRDGESWYKNSIEENSTVLVQIIPKIVSQAPGTKMEGFQNDRISPFSIMASAQYFDLLYGMLQYDLPKSEMVIIF